MKLVLGHLLLIALCVLGQSNVYSQDRPVGAWESHLPYNVGLGVATDGRTLYTICREPFFTYDASSGQTEPYSKVNGMSDIGMQYVAFDDATGTAVLAYADGNIDLFKNYTFYNIPDLKIKSIAGNKTVNQIYCEAGIAYVCTSVGILVIDLTTHNINETYQFIDHSQNVPVNGMVGNGPYFYAITEKGTYRADKSNPQLQNFQVWKRIDTTHVFNYVASFHDTVYVATTKSVYALLNDKVTLTYTCPQGPYSTYVEHTAKDPAQTYVTETVVQTTDSAYITHIDAGITGLLISEFRPNQFNGDVKVMDTTFHMIDSCRNIGWPLQAVQLSDNSIWIADQYYGLENRNQGNRHNPDGPADPNSFDIYAYNRDVWVVHGGISDKLDAIRVPHTASNLKDGNWKYYERYLYPPMDNFDDAVTVLKDEASGTLYIGSFVWGLFSMHADGTTELLNGSTSPFDSSDALFGQGEREVVGTALDQNGNLWVTEAFAYHQLYERTPDNKWYKYYVPGHIMGGPVVVDENGTVWYVGLSNTGVVAYNNNGTPADLSDDSYYHLGAGVGSGNLPSNTTHCIAKDKNNNIWVGTDNGIGIISNCTFGNGQVPVCDATIPIVQYDQFAGYLFAGNNVRSIAVDGANRKWVGTDDGVWLLSPDAQKIVYRFTTDNSPLPSNLIQKISIDKVTGDVYIGTDHGLVTYRSTATDTNAVTKSVTVFPNPVLKDYTGTVAIKGLPLNADVRITDINDQLVYKTTALGGQAVWNGRDYKGHRPQSGVYLIFASSSDGNQVYAGKIVFVQ